LDLLAGRIDAEYAPKDFGNLLVHVGEVFHRREAPEDLRARNLDEVRLSASDQDLFLEVFWDLFREGIITLGSDIANPKFPFCRVSDFGRRIIENQDTYFFHDVSTYTSLVKQTVPSIHPTTLLYLQEAMQAFRAGCLLSATVMLGVAAEHTFLLLMETIEQNPQHRATFSAVAKQRTILPKVNTFKKILDQQLKSIPPKVKEDLDTRFVGILSVIRQFRNESGHPSGKIIDRGLAYVLLNLFPSYCAKMYELRDHFAGSSSSSGPSATP
jgi:hypothetical protein